MVFNISHRNPTLILHCCIFVQFIRAKDHYVKGYKPLLTCIGAYAIKIFRRQESMIIMDFNACLKAFSCKLRIIRHIIVYAINAQEKN